MFDSQVVETFQTPGARLGVAPELNAARLVQFPERSGMQPLIPLRDERRRPHLHYLNAPNHGIW